MVSKAGLEKFGSVRNKLRGLRRSGKSLMILHAWEKAQARNELVRVCYSERIVGLLRNKKISASVYRRAGPQAAQDFARLLEAEGKTG